MPHGTPDWADLAPRKTVYGGIDLGELAARLGSIVTFDRRGDVVWFEDFSSGLGAWILGYTVTADKPTWSSVYARTKGFSCKLATSAVKDYLSYITHYMPIPIVSKIGLEFSFSLSTTNTIVECSLYYYDGTTRAYYAIRYNQADETLEYYGTDSAWHVFVSDIAPYPREYSFNTLKLVVDLNAVEFVRAILNEKEHSMADLVPWNETFDFTPYLQMQIKLENPAAAAKVVYIDDVIITQNEP